MQFRHKQMLSGALVVILAFAAGYFGFLVASHFAQKRETASAPLQPAALPGHAATQPHVQTPTRPGAPNAVPQQTQPAAPRRAAPERVYYLTERVSVMTEAGVMGINPGTQVLLLEQLANGNLQVTDGPEDFEVTPDQITDDPEIAQLAKRPDRAARQALATWKQRQIRPPVPPNITPAQPDAMETAPAAAEPVPSASPLERDRDSDSR